MNNNIEGDILECGVWRGGNSMVMAKTLFDLGETDRDIYIVSTGYPENHVNLTKGNVAETLEDDSKISQQVSFLRLDTDWYESTKKEFEVLLPRLVGGLPYRGLRTLARCTKGRR